MTNKIQTNFQVPITSSFSSKKAFKVFGKAVEEGLSRNGIYFKADVLKQASQSLKDTSVNVDHSQSVRDIIGKVDKSSFDEKEKAIMFEATIYDSEIQKMIKLGLVKHVSIEAIAGEIIEEYDEATKQDVLIPQSLTLLGLGIVQHPGVSGASITAMSLDTMIRESYDKELKEKHSPEEMKELLLDSYIKTLYD